MIVSYSTNVTNPLTKHRFIKDSYRSISEAQQFWTEVQFVLAWPPSIPLSVTAGAFCIYENEPVLMSKQRLSELQSSFHAWSAQPEQQTRLQVRARVSSCARARVKVPPFVSDVLKLRDRLPRNQFNFKEAQMGIKSVQMFCTLTRHTRFIMNFSYWNTSLKMLQPCLLE